MALYQYQALDDARDIRLITLLPGNNDDVISLSISHAVLTQPPECPDTRLSLEEVQATLPPGWTVFETTEGRYLFENDETAHTSWTHPLPDTDPSLYEISREATSPEGCPRYEALSYTWGAPEAPETAFVKQPGLETSTIELQQNLASALRHLRHKNKSRTLWIDAVCINQKDIPERNKQVTRMGDIYRLANRVVVWLGLESSNSKLALFTLGRIGEQVEMTKKNSRCRSPTAVHKDWYHSQFRLPYDQDTWQSILDLFQRPWFDRLWITQEIHLANQHSAFQCGNDEISWPLFRCGAICVFNKKDMLWPEFSDRAFELRQLMRYLPARNFFSQLLLSRNRLCSDPRDRIYGLLALASKKVSTAIQPDYSLSVSEVYRDTFLLQLNQTQRLDILMHTEWTTDPEHKLPSWVPDWSRPIEGFAVGHGSFCSATSAAQARFISPGVLEAAGVFCATISVVQEPLPKSAGSTSDGIRQWAPENLQTGYYVTGERLLDAFAWTVVDNCLRDRYPAVALYPSVEEVKTEVLDSVLKRLDSPDREAKSSITLGRLRNRSFIRTEEGYFGLGTPSSKPGDIICVILGCAAMIILRPTSSDRYQVVGSCHLHGFSDGSALLGPLLSPWKVHLRADSTGASKPCFHNPLTGENSNQDPRLGILSKDWEELEAVRNVDDPVAFARFNNKITGEVLNSDPRLLPEALRSRGINVQNFQLI